MDNYIGKQRDQIVPMLEKSFESVDVEEEFSNEAKGTIIDQHPNAGEEIIVKNTKVVFQVSKGPEKEKEKKKRKRKRKRERKRKSQ